MRTCSAGPRMRFRATACAAPTLLPAASGRRQPPAPTFRAWASPRFPCRRHDSRSGCVNNDVEALVGTRRNERAREQVECLFGHLVRMLAAAIALSQPLLADRV